MVVTTENAETTTVLQNISWHFKIMLAEMEQLHVSVKNTGSTSLTHDDLEKDITPVSTGV